MDKKDSSVIEGAKQALAFAQRDRTKAKVTRFISLGNGRCASVTIDQTNITRLRIIKTRGKVTYV